MTDGKGEPHFRQVLWSVLGLTLVFFFTGVFITMQDSHSPAQADLMKLTFSLSQMGFGGMVGLFGGKASG